MRFHWIVGLIVGSGVWLVGATQTFAKDDRLPYFKQPPSVQYDSDTRIATPYDVLDGPTYAVGAETRYGFQETALDSGTHGLPAHSVTLINSTLYFTDTTTPGWQQSNLRRGVAGRSTTELLLGKSPNNPQVHQLYSQLATSSRVFDKQVVASVATTVYIVELDFHKYKAFAGIAADDTGFVATSSGASLFLSIGDQDHYLYHAELAVGTLGSGDSEIGQITSITYRDFGKPVTILAPVNALPVLPPGMPRTGIPDRGVFTALLLLSLLCLTAGKILHSPRFSAQSGAP